MMTIDEAGAPGAGTPATDEAGWAGTVRFAGVMLLTLGAFQLVEGFTALQHGYAYLVTADGSLIELDHRTWGWAHLILGLISAAAGAGVLRGRLWARVIGVLLTTAGALFHFTLLGASPLWCTILICTEIVVIYALSAHGSVTRDPQIR